MNERIGREDLRLNYQSNDRTIWEWAKDLLILTLGALPLLTIFLGGVQTLPQTLATVSSKNNVTMDRNSANLTDILGTYENCSTWVGIAPEEGSENGTEIGCLQRILETQQAVVATTYDKVIPDEASYPQGT
jgi:hypothetical protein